MLAQNFFAFQSKLLSILVLAARRWGFYFVELSAQPVAVPGHWTLDTGYYGALPRCINHLEYTTSQFKVSKSAVAVALGRQLH